MAPHLAEVEAQKTRAVLAKDRLAALRKAVADSSEMDLCRAEVLAAEKTGRGAQSKADAIDAAVYDLKAVNPKEVADLDTRTTEEIIDSIEAHGETIRDALARLRDFVAEKV
jgi:type I restriction enzyme M protein